MHNLYLGLLRHHCVDVWGVDVKDKAESKIPMHSAAEQRSELSKVLAALQKNSLTTLMKLRKGYVVAVAELNGVVAESFDKKSFARALLDHVSHLID